MVLPAEKECASVVMDTNTYRDLICSLKVETLHQLMSLHSAFQMRFTKARPDICSVDNRLRIMPVTKTYINIEVC